jgi:hypothetical protein
MSMVFPSPSVAPSVATEFVNGVKFDVCEVISEAYDMLSDKKFRYFLCVEDTFIVNYSAAEQYFEKTGVARWDWFCRSKAECLAMIKDYAAKCEQVERWRQTMSQKSGISPMILPKISEANNYCIKRYGVKVAA